jgi:hypothetical protein
MIPLDVAKAMRMGEYHALINNNSLSMAHHDSLGIVTFESIRNAEMPDLSPIADNPPVSGAAGASDPTIAEVVRGIRARILPIVSDDRHQESGKYDKDKLDGPGSTVPDPHFRTGLAGRLNHRNAKR